MEIALKQRLIIAGLSLLALVGGWQIANGQLGLATFVAVLLVIWLFGRWTEIPSDAGVAGLVLIGYLVGNRGFAQVHPPNLPLLPGETALGLGCLLLAWRSARQRRSPIRFSALEISLLLLLFVGCARLRFDLQTFGLMALRDFATVYYAGFLFLAQDWAENERARAWLERCLTIGFALCPLATLAFIAWPEFLVAHTTIAGFPLIVVKTDVAGGLMAAGTIWFFGRRGSVAFAFGLLNAAGVFASNSRAAVIALGAIVAWTVACRTWSLARRFALTAAMGLVAVVLVSVAMRRPWYETPAYRVYESTASMVDYNGTRHYESAGLSDKPDNNRFRLVWWQAVAAETWQQAPWFGLGFGYDLTARFSQIYYAESTEEMNVRSPHNILLTMFGRMGFAGLAGTLLVLAVVARRTWLAGRAEARGTAAGEAFRVWLGAWGILVSACFGVVLEGPMGAVVFWSLLGFASAVRPAAAPETDAIIAAPASAALPSPATTV